MSARRVRRGRGVASNPAPAPVVPVAAPVPYYSIEQNVKGPRRTRRTVGSTSSAATIPAYISPEYSYTPTVVPYPAQDSSINKNLYPPHVEYGAPRRAGLLSIARQHALVSRGLRSLGFNRLAGAAESFGYGRKKRRPRRKKA